MFNYGLSQAQMTNQVQQVLVTLRDALRDAQALQAWSAGVSIADLQNVGYSAADASTLKSAIADANAVASIYITGQPPAGYPQAATAYPYQASQNQVVGPQ